jgi:glycyl-tRNA synthetase beta chain
LPTLLLEIGCEELPASACYEAEEQLPRLVREHLGVEPTRVFVGPRRLAVLVEELPERTPDEWAKGPPVALRERAAAGFARRYGLGADELQEREGHLWALVPGRPIREVLDERLDAIVRGVQFGKSMRWDDGGLRFSRPVRWICGKLGAETIGSGFSYGHRFTHGRLEIASSESYVETLRAAEVEPDAGERLRRIRDGLDTLGDWRDPLGKLREVVHLVEWPLVLEGVFDERYLRLPPRVVETAMQSHQRYFPLGGNRFAVVANGGDPDVVRAGNVQVLEARLEDAAFTFERDVAVGIDGLAARLGSITFFEGGGTFAAKTERLVELVGRLGGGEDAVEAARLAKADQAAELVREFPALEGHIGATYAELAARPPEVVQAIDEQYLPDAADAALPASEAGKVLSAADKIDTLNVSFGLGHRPTGSRDPYGLRRAAIGLARLALEGGLTVPRDLLAAGVRDFVEERLEGLLDVPVEFVRAARASAAADLADVAERARALAALDPARLAATHEVFTRAHRIAAKAEPGEWRAEVFADACEGELARALDEARPALEGDDLEAAFAAAERLAPVVARFFDEVLVMAPEPELRENRLRLLLDLRDAVGRLGDFSQIPL